MMNSSIIPSLFFFTLIAALLIGVVSYALFIRKRSNRHPVEEPSKAGRTMAPSRPER